MDTVILGKSHSNRTNLTCGWLDWLQCSNDAGLERQHVVQSQRHRPTVELDFCSDRHVCLLFPQLVPSPVYTPSSENETSLAFTYLSLHEYCAAPQIPCSCTWSFYCIASVSCKLSLLFNSSTSPFLYISIPLSYPPCSRHNKPSCKPHTCNPDGHLHKPHGLLALDHKPVTVLVFGIETKMKFDKERLQFFRKEIKCVYHKQKMC